MATTGVNFVKQSFTLSGVSTPVVSGYAPAAASQVANLLAGVILDKFGVDLSGAGYAKNGGFFLALAVSTPVIIDLTAISSAAPATGGDTVFALANEIVFNNTGAADVIVSPGASNPFLGPLAGTAPTFTVPAGAKLRWHSPAGWAVSGAVKTLKFDPGASVAQIGVCVGGS